MSTVAIVLIVIGSVLVLLFVAGLVAARRHRNPADLDERIRAADRALEAARATDRGWDRDLMAHAAGKALTEQRPGYEWETIELVLVDDHPGVVDDRCELTASGPHGPARVVLARREGGEWFAEHVE